MPKFVEKYRNYFRDFFSPQQIGKRKTSTHHKSSPAERNYKHPVTPREAELLKTACENEGTLFVDPGSASRPYAVVTYSKNGKKSFGSECHDAAAAYVEAVRLIMDRGLMKPSGNGYYSLTSSGWTEANKL